jgi:hypothetical protein
MAILEIRVDRERVTVDDELAVAISTPPQPSDRTTSSEFVLAIDASPSMAWPVREGQVDGPTRWDLARRGALALVTGLDPDIDMHVVMFDGDARVIADGRSGSLARRMDGLLPVTLSDDMNGTNIESTLRTSYRLLEKSSATSRRILLLSDGEPTMGNLSPAFLAGLAREAASRDIYTDPIGLGAAANVDLLLELSGTGGCDHVASRNEADRIIGEVMHRLGEVGQRMVASGGELAIEVSPFFAVLGVYQLMPTCRTLVDVASRTGGGPTVLTVPLGAIGAGEHGRPVIAIKLRAPRRTSSAPLPLLKASGTIRSRRGMIQLAGSPVTVWPVMERVAPDPTILDKIREVELEAETADLLKRSADEQHPDVYHEAEKRARSEGLDELAGRFARAIDALHGGLEANDVRNETRATSSRSTSTPRSILRERPTVPPSSRKRSPVRPAENDDWSDEPVTGTAASGSDKPGRPSDVGGPDRIRDDDDPDLTDEGTAW